LPQGARPKILAVFTGGKSVESPDKLTYLIFFKNEAKPAKTPFFLVNLANNAIFYSLKKI
jgi:hypothetical protein